MSEAEGSLLDGMAGLTYVDSADKVQALWLWLTGRAQAAKGPSGTDHRTTDQRRADVLGDLGEHGLASEDLPVRHGRRPQLQVTVGLGTLLGLDDQPGELAGYGPITADTARRIAAGGTWRRLLTEPRTGRVDELSVDCYTPPQDMADHVIARDKTCRGFGCRTPPTAATWTTATPTHEGPRAQATWTRAAAATTRSRPTPTPSSRATATAACTSPCPPGSATTSPPNPSSKAPAPTTSSATPHPSEPEPAVRGTTAANRSGTIARMEKVAWVLIREGRLLVARNHGRHLFYLPGGRREPNESHADCLVREAMEELSVQISPATMRLAAEVTAPRDGAPGLVRMTCYTAEYEGDLAPGNEIAEVGWFTLADYARVTSAEQRVMDRLVTSGQLLC